jgi:hypothetical protein
MWLKGSYSTNTFCTVILAVTLGMMFDIGAASAMKITVPGESSRTIARIPNIGTVEFSANNPAVICNLTFHSLVSGDLIQSAPTPGAFVVTPGRPHNLSITMDSSVIWRIAFKGKAFAIKTQVLVAPKGENVCMIDGTW